MKQKVKEIHSDDYTQLKSKISLRFFGMAMIALLTIIALYLFVWRRKGGDWVVSLFVRFGMDLDYAYYLYHVWFRNNKNLIFGASVILVFFVLLRFLFSWIIQYFHIMNQGIDALLNESETEILLPSEMQPLERKLNTVKQTLKQRTLDAQLAEQRKNDLVMYLAHDIRTPLTSVIGYLNLLEEASDMPIEQRAKYVHITLDKAYRLEKMLNEFFEITRYNLQQIHLSKEKIDLYYMLVQLSDELSPLLSQNGNTTILKADENLTIYGDPDKLARVFNNVLKNAASYSYSDTEIVISVVERDYSVCISFQNKGEVIPNEKLSALFEKFYRLDESRTLNTGGTGLGLSIAKEIIDLHCGTITAESEDNTVRFVITLPIGDQ